MKIWRLIKYIFLDEYERQRINNLAENIEHLLNFFYFIKWKSDIPSFDMIDRHMKRATKFFYRTRIYGRIGLIIYFLIMIIFYILVKNPPFYLYIPVTLIALTIDLCISKFLTHRDKVRFCVSLLIYDLVTIIMLIESVTLRNRNIVNMEEKYLPELEEKRKRLSTNDQGKNTGDVDSVEDHHGDAARTKAVLIFLEEAAKYVETYLPSRLSSKDILTDDWFKDSMREVAAALREKKKWVLTPKRDTNAYLVAKLTSTLICLVDGDWDALERVAISKAPRSASTRLFLSFSLRSLKTLFVAILPLLAFMLLQLSPFAINGTPRDYVSIGVLLWFGITVLINLDSNIGTKISLMKDLRQLL